MDTFSRRSFLRHIAMAIGGSTVLAASGNSLAVAKGYQHKHASDVCAGKLFDLPQMRALYAICNTVLPATDTPGAGELDCHGFVDHQLLHCHSKDQQADCQAIIARINTACQHQYHCPFNQASPAKREQLLQDIEAQKGFSELEKQRFIMLKSLIVFGYFTTEVGATQALAYQAVPGGFTASIPNTEQTKAWGSLAYY